MKEICIEILEKHKYIVNSVTYLRSGASSTIYKCSTNKGDLALKIKMSENASLENEFKILKLIEKHKISPKAYFHGIYNNNPYLIEDFVEGRRLPWRGMKTEDVLLVADFFNKLHSIKINDESKIKEYELKKHLKYPEKFIHKNKEFKELYNIAEKKLDSLKLENLKALRHTDPNPHNFIKTKNKIISVDFEESKIGHPAIDVADFFIKANLNIEKQNRFYSKYRTKNMKREVDVFMITGLLGLIAWKLDRVDLIKQKKIHKNNYKSLDAEKKSAQTLIKKLKKLLR